MAWATARLRVALEPSRENARGVPNRTRTFTRPVNIELTWTASVPWIAIGTTGAPECSASTPAADGHPRERQQAGWYEAGRRQTVRRCDIGVPAQARIVHERAFAVAHAVDPAEGLSTGVFPRVDKEGQG